MKLDPFSLITDDVDHSWTQCLPHWIAAGRVQDKPHNLHVGRYKPSAGTTLGLEFAYAFYQDVEFIIAKLRSADSTIRLIAYDLLEMIAWEYYKCDIDLPVALTQLEDPIPQTALEEIQNCHRFRDYAGATVGSFLPFMLEHS